MRTSSWRRWADLYPGDPHDTFVAHDHLGRKAREQASIAYLRKYVMGLRHWLQGNPPFASSDDRRNAQQDAEQALRVLDSL
jgi:hypothetical protein